MYKSCPVCIVLISMESVFVLNQTHSFPISTSLVLWIISTKKICVFQLLFSNAFKKQNTSKNKFIYLQHTQKNPKRGFKLATLNTGNEKNNFFTNAPPNAWYLVPWLSLHIIWSRSKQVLWAQVRTKHRIQ